MSIDNDGGATDASRDRLLESILVEYLLRCEEGDPPDIDVYLARHPRHAEEIAALLAFDAAPPPRPAGAGGDGRRLGDWNLLYRVSAGGGGTVYRARHRETGVDVALKVLGKRDAIDEREIERLKHEARMLEEMRLERVGSVLELSEIRDAWVMAMPWIEGINLQQAIAILSGDDASEAICAERLDLPNRVEIFFRVAETLATLHARGILHRDLKPSNIMIDATLEPVIIDFGIARKEGYTQLTKTADAPLGTPRFLAPELLLGDAHSATPASDVYSLGVTFYEVLTTRRAFDGRDRATLYEQIRDGVVAAPHEADPAIDLDLSAIILRAMARNPKERYPTIAALLEDLRRYRAGRKLPRATRRCRSRGARSGSGRASRSRLGSSAVWLGLVIVAVLAIISLFVLVFL